MISLKVLSTAAVMALVLPMAIPAASFAQHQGGAPGAHAGGGGGGGGGFRGGGGGGFRAGAAPAQHFSGGSPGPRFSGGGGQVQRFSGGAPGRRFDSDRDGGRRFGRRGNGFYPGVAFGGSLAYYGDSGYYDDGAQYYDDGPTVVVGPSGGDDDSVAYCIQTYRSYNPRLGTYLGNDGFRHACP